MRPILFDNGELWVPMRAESEDGDTVGDAMLPVSEDHENYTKWLNEAITEAEARRLGILR